MPTSVLTQNICGVSLTNSFGTSANYDASFNTSSPKNDGIDFGSASLTNALPPVLDVEVNSQKQLMEICQLHLWI